MISSTPLVMIMLSLTWSAAILVSSVVATVALCQGSTPCPRDNQAYFFCQEGAAKNGCRSSTSGAFPSASCISQCITGTRTLPSRPSPLPPPSPTVKPLNPRPSPSPPPSPSALPGKWSLVWSDEFKAGALIDQVMPRS